MIKRVILVLGLLFAVFFASRVGVLAAAGINHQISFQGKVVNKDGTNVADNNYNFTFSIYNVLSGGSSIWTETWSSGTTQVAVTSGIFNVNLGTYSSIPGTVDFNNDSVYLGVNFNGDGEMSPRIRATAVPYAYNAEKVNGLTVTNTNGTLTIPSGKTIAFGDSFVTTGVGISLDQSLSTKDSPNFTGLSIGSSAITATAKELNYLHSLAVGNTGALLYVSGVGITQLNIGNSGYFLTSDGTKPVWASAALGAGTSYSFTNGLTDPGTHLVGLGGTLTANTQIGISSYSLTFTNSSTMLRLDSSGNVGIGTTNPLYKLDITGDMNLTGGINIGSSLYISTTQTVAGSGSSGAPGYSFITDKDTGMYSLGSNILAFSVGSSQALQIAANGSVFIGSGANGFMFNPATGIGYSGTGRPSKKIVLSPEYSGATLSKDDSTSNDGSMTSDSTLNSGGIGWKNYYEWSSTNAAVQDYSVLARVTLPNDFDSWETGSCPGTTCALEFNFQTGLGTTASNYVAIRVNNDTDTPATAVCSIGGTASTVWASTGCTSSLLSSGSSPQWNSAGQQAVIRIKLAASNAGSAVSRTGDIILRYKAKF